MFAYGVCSLSKGLEKTGDCICTVRSLYAGLSKVCVHEGLKPQTLYTLNRVYNMVLKRIPSTWVASLLHV